MDCPRCDAPTRVLESRRAEQGAATRRRRSCPACEHRFTTFERRDPEPLAVIKRSGERQPFDREKLRSALLRACHKRDVDPRELDLIVDGVEARVERAGGELGAERIGELCLEGLEPLDRGAFLQFAGTLPGALPEGLGKGRKQGESGLRSVRAKEEAAELPPKTERERVRGDF